MDSILENCGLELSPVLQLRCENSFQFVRSLEQKLAEDSKYGEDFVAEFKAMCAGDEERLITFLSPLETMDSSNDSLVQIIMASSVLQNGVMAALVDVLGKFCGV